MGEELGRGTLERYGDQAELRPRGSLGISGPRELFASHLLRGAYDSSGRLVEETRRLWSLGGGQPDPSLPTSIPEPTVDHVHAEEVVWGGGFVFAYGHFLTESVSRLWPLLPGGKLEGMPVVWATLRPTPYVEEWCEAFRLRTIELPWEGMVCFPAMHVPEPAWRLSAWIAPEIRDVHLYVRKKLEVPRSSKSGVLWLSRSGLDRARVAYDEVLLEWLLREHVTLVRPEEMSLVDQIAAVESSDAVVGIVGSAFHTMLVAEDLPACTMLCAGPVRAAYVDQDLLLEQEATFLHTLAIAEARPSKSLKFPRKFPFGYRVLIPETLRGLARTVLPNLLEDGNLEILAEPERLSSRVRNPAAKDELLTAIARVLIDPLWMHARMRLGRTFEEKGLHRCALEQYEMVAELSDDYAERASQYAERSLARMESDE